MLWFICSILVSIIYFDSFLAKEPGNQTLSPGAIAGIAIGSVVFIIIIVSIVYYFYKKRSKLNNIYESPIRSNDSPYYKETSSPQSSNFKSNQPGRT